MTKSKSLIVEPVNCKEILTLDTEPTIMDMAGFLGRLCADKFFGKIVIQLENGKIELVRKEQTLKPDDLRIS